MSDAARPGTNAFAAVVEALARRDLTSKELEERLTRAGFPAEARTDAIVRAGDAGYVDDERVAVERARRLAERDASDAAIRAELMRRGVRAETIELALALLVPETERAARLVQKLGVGPRAARALARKGYPGEAVAGALGAEIAE